MTYDMEHIGTTGEQQIAEAMERFEVAMFDMLSDPDQEYSGFVPTELVPNGTPPQATEDPEIRVTTALAKTGKFHHIMIDADRIAAGNKEYLRAAMTGLMVTRPHPEQRATWDRYQRQIAARLWGPTT